MTGAGNNTYLIVGDNGSAALIDAGVGEARHLADIDAALNARQARLDRVFVTHGHADHAAGAPALPSAQPPAAVFPVVWARQDPQLSGGSPAPGARRALRARPGTLAAVPPPAATPEH